MTSNALQEENWKLPPWLAAVLCQAVFNLVGFRLTTSTRQIKKCFYGQQGPDTKSHPAIVCYEVLLLSTAGVVFKKNRIKPRGPLCRGGVTLAMVIIVCFTVITQQRTAIKREGETGA